VFTLCLSARSEAAPILVSFSDVLPVHNGPLDGLALSGSFSYDDPYGITGCAPSCTFGPLLTFPMLSFSLSVGTHQFNLSNTVPGAYVQGPLGHFAWGPVVQIAPAFLPSGITGMSLTADALARFSYTTASAFFCCYEPPLTFTLLPRQSVPGPGSLAVCLSALLALGVRFQVSRRGSRATRSRPTD
jgi:hypothetical protein